MEYPTIFAIRTHLDFCSVGGTLPAGPGSYRKEDFCVEDETLIKIKFDQRILTNEKQVLGWALMTNGQSQDLVTILAKVHYCWSRIVVLIIFDSGGKGGRTRVWIKLEQVGFPQNFPVCFYSVRILIDFELIIIIVIISNSFNWFCIFLLRFWDIYPSFDSFALCTTIHHSQQHLFADPSSIIRSKPPSSTPRWLTGYSISLQLD